MPPFKLRSLAWPHRRWAWRGFPTPNRVFLKEFPRRGLGLCGRAQGAPKGDPKAMVAAEISAMATGGYASAQCEVITTPEDFLDEAQRAADLTAAFDAPNRDEIDRMLMEE